MQEELGHVRVASQRCIIQGSGATSVSAQRVRPPVDEKLDDMQMAVSRRQVQGRSTIVVRALEGDAVLLDPLERVVHQAALAALCEKEGRAEGGGYVCVSCDRVD